jgi:RimJ/RimL family protein N-acetyltransferase
MSYTNDLGQPIGYPVPNWTSRRQPLATTLVGRWCRLEPLELGTHADDLYDANRADEQGGMWTYLPYGPFGDRASYRAWVKGVAGREDPLLFAILNQEQGRAVGVAAFQRMNPQAGSIEIGQLAFSPALRGTTAATAAMALMLETVFDELGYRRCEWKCDALNARSRRAALRLGFSYEGTFRQAAVVKERNRDAVWLSIIDTEWPRLAAAYRRWLSPDNFDSAGHQRTSLSDLTRGTTQTQAGGRPA